MRSFLTPYLQIETMKHGSLEERTGIAEIGGGKIFITTGKYAVNFWCWEK